MRVVTARARHAVRAAAEDEVARLSGIDMRPTGGMASLPALPGVRILAEEHGVAADAGAVDPFGVRGRPLLAAARLPADERAPYRERGATPRIRDVLARSVVTGFAPDAELEEVRFTEPASRLVGGRLEQGVEIAPRAGPEQRELLGHGAAEAIPVDALEPPQARGRQEPL